MHLPATEQCPRAFPIHRAGVLWAFRILLRSPALSASAQQGNRMSFVATPAAVLNPWVRILGALEKKINRQSFDTWFKPTRFSHVKERMLFVRIPTPEFQHVGERYADLIQEAIDNLQLEFDDVTFITPEEDPTLARVREDGGFAPVRHACAQCAGRRARNRAGARRRRRNRPASTGRRRRSSTRATPLTPSLSAQATSLLAPRRSRGRTSFEGL